MDILLCIGAYSERKEVMKMESVWWENCERTELGTLRSDLKVDVLIIGGGMAGILCAHRLKAAGVDCAVVEAGRIFGMTTKNTTAKITSCHGLIYDKMIKMRGVDAARGYLMSQNAACREFARLCRDVNCDYETRDSYVYSRNDREKLEREVRAIERLGGSAELCEITELPIKTAGGVRVHDQAQFNPLKLGYKIAKELPIYENTRVTRILPGRVKTEHGEIRCEKIIVATHFPVLNRHGSYFLKMYQHRSYVLAVENAQKLHGMYVDEDERGMSFRSYGEVLLLGGGAHRTGKHGGSYAELERFSRSHYPTAGITNRWAAQDCMTLDGVPYIGQYSLSTPSIYVATGFNKWGMSSSMVSAMMLSDMVMGRPNEYDCVYSPSRSMLTPQLAVNLFESVVGLLSPTVPRCSHLGCALKYNPAEHTWDCSCHGSRFSRSGEIIDDPANKDINV